MRPIGPGTMAAGMRERTGDELLGLPVRLHGVQLARPVDLLLDPNAHRAVGLDLLCGDEMHRFLPLQTAEVGKEEIRILSPFVLLEQRELEFYRSRTLALGRLGANRSTGMVAGSGSCKTWSLPRTGNWSR